VPRRPSDRVEFLKGAAAIESGVGSLGGSVNYVTKQPFSGPVRNETFVSVDSFRGVRSGFDSGGSTPIAGLDYRVTASFDKFNGFIDDTRKDLSTLTARLNYQNSDVLRTWIAFEYYNDQANQYWGTPMTPVSFSGPFSTPGVVSGSRNPLSGGSFIGPVTVDSRTLTTNYNSLDNHDDARQYWGRTGFDLEITPDLLLKEQAYLYKAQRTFFDEEFFSFNPASVPGTAGLVDRNPFYVAHNQHLIGNVTDLTWNSSFFGMPNKFAAEIAASRNFLRFTQQANFTSTTNTVSLIDPARGFFGPLVTNTATTQLDWVSESFEERLKVTPTIALIGGVRIDEMKITNNSFDATTGAEKPNFPVSKTWEPVSYRAAATWEPIEKLVFYGLYATSYDPASAPIQLAGFQAASGFPLTLTSSRIEEVGVKQSLWNNRAEWTLAAFDLDRRNVLEVVNSGPPPVFGIAGEIESKGVELGGAIRPVDALKLWGNIAYTHARFGSDILVPGSLGQSAVTVNGNVPANVAPIIVNAGASYRFEPLTWPIPWPVEIGASVRHVGNRYINTFNDVTMDEYTFADAYMFIDFEKTSWLPSVDRTRLAFWARNLTNRTYANFVDPGTPNQVYLGAPRSYEAALSFKFGTTAEAAHLDAGYRKAPPLLFGWRGFYLGGNLGGAFSEEKASTPLGPWSPNPSGVLGGIQLGYDFIAASNWLIGIEGELDWTSAQGTVVIPNLVAAATVTSNHNWYDTLEGRLGYFQGPWLYYFKGGAAWLGADYRLTGDFNGVTTLQSVTNTRSGWTVGAGIEYMWTPNWSAKAEYDFLDFGTQNLGFGALGTTISVNTHVNEFKVGFNYHWLPGTLFGAF